MPAGAPHYRGFAANQQRLLEKEPTIKRLLYVLRTALTGTHLLRTGELETDLLRLPDAYDLRDARALVEAKRAGERTAPTPRSSSPGSEARETLSRLDAARNRSVLPEDPRGIPALDAWLVALRRARF